MILRIFASIIRLNMAGHPSQEAIRVVAADATAASENFSAVQGAAGGAGAAACWLYLSGRADTLFPLLPILLNTPPSFDLCLGDLDRSRLILENTLVLGLREHLDLCLFSFKLLGHDWQQLIVIFVAIFPEGCVGRGPTSVLRSWIFSSPNRVPHGRRGLVMSGLFMIAHGLPSGLSLLYGSVLWKPSFHLAVSGLQPVGLGLVLRDRYGEEDCGN
ncbi:hypothetical protein Tco_0810306 [Tanacetum coccineum]